MINQCITSYERTLYLYLEEGKIEITEALRSSKPLETLIISSDSDIYIKELDNGKA